MPSRLHIYLPKRKDASANQVYPASLTDNDEVDRQAMDAKAEMVVNGTIISIEDFKSEALAFTTWDPWKNIPISILIGSSLVAGGLSRCGIINFLRKGAPKRPVNTNFLIDQVCAKLAFNF